MPVVTLKNPHSVLEALRQRPQDVIEVRLSRRTPQDSWQQVTEAARHSGVPVRIIPGGEKSGGGRRGDSTEGRGGAAEAVVREREPVNLQDLFAGANQGTGLWLALDQVQDPHNVGAIFRTAAFFGVRGMVLTRHKSAPVTAIAYDVASGGVEHVPYALEANLRQAMEVGKEAGLWVLGTSEHVAQSVWQVDRGRSWLVVLGNEEEGLRRLTAETCDELCCLPSQGAIASLNVSVAAGVLLGALTGAPRA